MNKTPYQFRYYGDKNEKNNPLTITKNELVNDNIFSKYNKHHITQIGIQGTPGVQFKLNDGDNWIEIGKTGIYELDLEGKGYIENIVFNNNLALAYKSPESNILYLFIDILYQDPNNSIIDNQDFYKDNKDFNLIISGGKSTEEGNDQ